MSRFFNNVFFLIILSAISCSYLPLSRENFKLSRKPSSDKSHLKCHELLSSFLMSVQYRKGEGVFSENMGHALRLVTGVEQVGVVEFVEKVKSTLKLRYPGVRVEEVENTGPLYFRNKKFKISISDTQSFEILETRAGVTSEVKWAILFPNVERAVDGEFYLDSLTLLNSKDLIHFQEGDIGGAFVQKLKVDLMIRSLFLNFSKLKKGLKSKSKQELLALLDSSLRNLDDFSDDIYLAGDKYIITDYFNLIKTILDLRNTELRKIRAEEHEGLNRLEKLLYKFKQRNFYKSIFARTKVTKENEVYYNRKLKGIQDRPLWGFRDKDHFEAHFQQYIFLKQMGDKSSVYSHLRPDIDYQKFYFWYRSQDTEALFEAGLADNVRLRDYFLELVEKYRQFETNNPTWTLFSSKKDRKLFAEMEENLREKAAASYNDSVLREVTSINSISEFKREMGLAIFNFRAFEPNFNSIGFYHWMGQKEIPSIQDFERLKKKYQDKAGFTVGDYLESKYIEYAPYAKYDEKLELPFFKRFSHRVKEKIGMAKYKMKNCRENKNCINEIIVKNIQAVFKKDSYKKKFNCLASQPALLANSFRDLGLYALSLGVIYKYSDLERFPWELLATSVTFNIFVDEKNCRVGKSSLRRFGKAVDPKKLEIDEFVQKQFTKESFKDLSVMSIYSISGLTFYNILFNELYLSMGYPVSENIEIEDAGKMFLFNYLHFGAWANFKKMLVWLPGRLKLLPKVVKNLQNKFPGRRSSGGQLSDYYNFIAESLFYTGMSVVNTLDYIFIYKAHVMPILMNIFGLEIEGFVSKDDPVYEVSNITVASKEIENVFVNRKTLSNGVITEVKYRKVKEGDGSETKMVFDVKNIVPEDIKEKINLVFSDMMNLFISNQSTTPRR